MSPGWDWLAGEALEEDPRISDESMGVLELQVRLDTLETFRSLFTAPDWPAFEAHLAEQEAAAISMLRRDLPDRETVSWRARANVFRELVELRDEVESEIASVLAQIHQQQGGEDA